MDWITPKTNWEGYTDSEGVYHGDYYNLGDAQRIANNISYLKEMALEIYGTLRVDCLVFRENWLHGPSGSMVFVPYYGVWSSVRISNATVYPASQYTRDMTSWVYYDAYNLLALTEIAMFSYQSAPASVSNYGIDYNIDNSRTTPAYTYSGTCINNGGSRWYITYADPVYSIWNMSRQSSYYNFPLTSSFSNNSSKCNVNISVNYSSFMNKPFYKAETLNCIEAAINRVYSRLSSYLA